MFCFGRSMCNKIYDQEGMHCKAAGSKRLSHNSDDIVPPSTLLHNDHYTIGDP